MQLDLQGDDMKALLLACAAALGSVFYLKAPAASGLR